MSEFKFNYGWRKPLETTFIGKPITLEVILDAYEGEEITEEQKQAYEKYRSSQEKYNNAALRLIRNYIDKNNIEDTGVQIKSLYIQRNGEFALLAECDWDIENGIAIILSPSEKVTVQDNFL